MDFWYKNANFYHIYVLGLCNAPFDNDFTIFENRLGEIEKWIPHIKEMGCNAVYFSPVFKSKTHGYDTADYCLIDNRIGDNKSFKALVGKFHQNGIKVVLDAVFNHCGRDFHAFKDICEKGQASYYTDWFSGITFDKASPYGDHFSYDTWSGYFELVKFNLKNPAVKKQLFDAVDYWIQYFDIDGLRLDAADCLDWDFMKELRRVTTALKPDFWLMGEVVHGDYGKWVNADTLHSVTNYELYKSLYASHNDNNLYELAYSLKRGFAAGTGIYENLLLYNFADNHDQNRLASVVNNPAHLYTIYILLYTMPGIPSLYYGSEWGIKGEKANDSDRPLRPYIDINNISGNAPDLMKTIKKLSAIRYGSKALKSGGYKQLFIAYQKPFAFERTFGEEKVIVVVNIGDYADTVNLKQYGMRFFDMLNNEDVDCRDMGDLTVYPHWGRVLKAI